MTLGFLIESWNIHVRKIQYILVNRCDSIIYSELSINLKQSIEMIQ